MDRLPYTVNRAEMRRTTVELTALSPNSEGLTAFIPISAAPDFPVGSTVFLGRQPMHGDAPIVWVGQGLVSAVFQTAEQRLQPYVRPDDVLFVEVRRIARS